MDAVGLLRAVRADLHRRQPVGSSVAIDSAANSLVGTQTATDPSTGLPQPVQLRDDGVPFLSPGRRPRKVGRPPRSSDR